MLSWILKADINTFDNRPLLKAGRTVTIETLEELISLNRDEAYHVYPLLHYETIQRDLIHCISQHPYQGIFSIGDKFNELLNCMKNVFLPEPVLMSLVSLKVHDPYTYRHTITVFALSTLLATLVIEDFQERIKEATSSPSHDIGKICVPADILQKAGPLTRDELAILDQHTVAGFILLSYYYRDTGNLSAIVARDHHEKKNGKGYPSGINLDNPLVEIVVVCDIYDALISPRPYRPISYDNRTALEVLTSMVAAKEVNEDVVKALVTLNRKDKPHYKECILSEEKRGTAPENNNYGKIEESSKGPEEGGND